MGDRDGYEVTSSDLKKIIEICVAQIPALERCIPDFFPAKLDKSDFGLAPGADHFASAYVDGTAKHDYTDKRYESTHGYLQELRDALKLISDQMGSTAHAYRAAHEASGGGATG